MHPAVKHALRKSPTGITGLDEITGGGLPTGRPTLVCGSAGCGKKLLAMKILVRGAVEFGEPGVFMMHGTNEYPFLIGERGVSLLPIASLKLDRAAPVERLSTGIVRFCVTGSTPRAIVNTRTICDENLRGVDELEIEDISRHPALTKGEKNLAASTLIKKRPLPLRRLFGDLSRIERIALGLHLRQTKNAHPPSAQ